MDAHTLTVLEFGKVITFLKQFATSPQGQRLCEQLVPLHSLPEIKTLLTEVTEMKDILTVYDDIPIHGIKDIEELILKTKVEGFYMEPREFQDIVSTLETIRNLKAFFSATGSKYTTLQGITKNLIPLKELEDTIKSAIGNQGEIRDTASHELYTIRLNIKNLKSTIRSTLEELLHQDDLRFIFQEQFITIRNGRFVLPVKTDHQAYLPGVVHDHSHTKATYFIEPIAVVNLNNQLQILTKEELREEIRILKSLTAKIKENLPELVTNLSLLEKLDLIYAKAQLSRALNATEPILNEEGIIRLNACRHPILLARFEPFPAEEPSPVDTLSPPSEPPGRWVFDASQVVPTHIHLDKGIKTLILTGANAGGKTVTLKTLGLLTLMAQAGMHIPVAEGSTLTVFRSVFADIGDEQNIAENLSTFSAHIRQLNHILSKADAHSLILIDELGAGTEPAEGAALGLAVLDYLRNKQASVVITSHLTLLKTYPYLHHDVENVSVEFDPVTMKPTYHLVYGIPGMSYALAIARNLGMSDTILDAANHYLDDKEKKLLDLMKGLEQTQRIVTEKQSEIAKLREKVSLQENLATSLLEVIKTKKTQLLADYERKLQHHLKEAQTRLEQIIAEAKQKERVSLNETRKSIQEVKKAWNTHIPSPPQLVKPVVTLKVGQTVKLLHSNQEGIVLKADHVSKKAEVLVGEKRVKAGFDTIEYVLPKEEENPSSTLPPCSGSKASYSAHLHDDALPSTINVIGMTVDESLPLVDRTIDHALIKGTERIEIIHGLGTGRLKEAIRMHLKNHRYVKRFWSDEQTKGGAGVTQVEIQFHPKSKMGKNPQSSSS